MSPHARTSWLLPVMVILAFAVVAALGVPAHAVAGPARRDSALPRTSFERASALGSRDSGVPSSSVKGRAPVRPSLAGVVAAGTGPVNPIPDTLWRPSVGSVPLSGNYVYLDSDVGDYVGQGQQYLYTPANAAITVSGDGGYFSVAISGNKWWRGDFQTMDTIAQLQPGYYPGMQRYPFHDYALGGLAWYGDGRASNTLTGWFVVDSATYTDGTLTAIDLRFEQHSEGGVPALHGAIHWRADGDPQPGEPDDEIPGVDVCPPATISGTLDPWTDNDDVYRVMVPAGTRLVVELAGAAGTDFDIFVFGPGTTSVNGNEEPVAWSAEWDTSTERVEFTASDAGPGYYYIDVYADPSTAAAGNYTLKLTSSTTLLPVYRFYNLKQGVHFYTASEAEKDSVIARLSSVYRFEGPSYTINLANPNNTLPVYRFYNMKAGVHFYTASEAEKNQVINTLSGVYRFEGPSYNVSTTSANAFPVYRFYNIKQGVHFYTASEVEKTNVINTLSGVYRFEGVSYYVGQ